MVVEISCIGDALVLPNTSASFAVDWDIERDRRDKVSQVAQVFIEIL